MATKLKSTGVEFPDSTTQTTEGVTSITAGNALTGGGSGDSVTIDHEDTSSQSSVSNSGSDIIQSVTLDDFGHVTGLSSTSISAGGVGTRERLNGSGTFTVPAGINKIRVFIVGGGGGGDNDAGADGGSGGSSSFGAFSAGGGVGGNVGNGISGFGGSGGGSGCNGNSGGNSGGGSGGFGGGGRAPNGNGSDGGGGGSNGGFGGGGGGLNVQDINTSPGATFSYSSGSGGSGSGGGGSGSNGFIVVEY